MSRGRQVSIEIHRKVTELFLAGYGPAQIYRQLFPDGYGSPDHVSEKTIQRLVKDLRPRGPSEPWSFLDADPGEAARVIDVVAWALTASEGRYWPSKDEIGWIARVRAVAPEIPLPWAYYVAWGYIFISDQPNPDSRALDFTLGAEPWYSEDQARDWADALQRCGIIEKTDPDVLDVLEFSSKINLRGPVIPEPDTQSDALSDGWE